MISYRDASLRWKEVALGNTSNFKGLKSVDLKEMARKVKVKQHYNSEQGAIAAAKGLYSLKARVDREIVEKVIRTDNDQIHDDGRETENETLASFQELVHDYYGTQEPEIFPKASSPSPSDSRKEDRFSTSNELATDNLRS